MKLSVLIVNYNVEYFLEQCLHSVRKASRNVSAEIFVIDNNSVDGSLAMVKQKFPEVILIENKKNTGFSYANNQAIKLAQGEYILLLNPDTIVEEDTFEKAIRFMDNHPEAGGLGVQMIDGKGNFLPESKRGLPTPEVAFYKIFGLSALLPKSKKFGKYHLGYLDKNKIHEVDILSGAFMLLRKNTLDKVGLLDEAFFMYGEDIDLSYRIIKAGYKNYYFPETRIIHYKGESTKKSSINYVFVFYNAMNIFANKHFSHKNAKLFSLLINFAVYLRASTAILHRFIQKAALPLFDAAVIFTGLHLLKSYWEKVVKAGEGLHFQEEILTIAFPIYILTWLASVYFSGGYDKPVKLSKVIRGVIAGTIIILILYALLSEEYRFSRALILLGAAWTALSTITTRLALNFFKIKGYDLDIDQKKRIVIVGDPEEFKRVSALLKQTDTRPSFTGNVRPDNNNDHKDGKQEEYLGNIRQLQEIIVIYKIDEVIFCAKNLPAQKIIEQMALQGSNQVNYKIAPPESLYIIGSNSIDTSGELYTISINSITKASNIRSKRLFDLLTASSLILISPLSVFFMNNSSGLLKNIMLVLFGKKSWVGYTPEPMEQSSGLPAIKKGVLNPTDALKNMEINENNISKLNQLYAKDYKTTNDLNILLKGFKHLGRP